MGVKINKMRIENGVWAREMSLEQYVCDKVKTVESYLLDKTKGNWRRLMKRADNNFLAATGVLTEAIHSDMVEDYGPRYVLYWAKEFGPL